MSRALSPDKQSSWVVWDKENFDIRQSRPEVYTYKHVHSGNLVRWVAPYKQDKSNALH